MEKHDGLADKNKQKKVADELLCLPLLFITVGEPQQHHRNPPHHQPPVKENAADIIVGDGRLLGAGGHAQWPQEVVDQDVELLHILGLGLQHAEHDLVPLPHALSVRRPDVVLDDGFPLPAANPASQEALDL